MACEILVPLPRIKLVPPAVEVQRPNHWIAREIPMEKINITSKEKISVI